MDPRGAIYDSGRLRRRADATQKTWWVQAESLLSALFMHRRSGKEQYARLFNGLLEWIHDKQIDWEHGEWHRTIDPRGRPCGMKADQWKSAYHNGRAILQCLDLLEPITSQPISPNHR